jgi:type IV pilus assembly protein PilX
MNRYRTSSGFALIASLLFLVVLTILGLSSMSGVGLQERMAANLKEKERASEAAEVAARGAELYLADYAPTGVLEEIPDARSTVVSGQPPPNVWTLDGPIPATTPPMTSTEKLQQLATNDAIWANAITFTAPPFNDNTLIGAGINATTGASEKYAARPQSYTEESAFMPYTLNPEDLATGAGRFYYRVTGRGVGGNATAVSVVQSMYTRRFK